MKTVVGLFDNLSEAHRAVDELSRLGLSRSDISVIAPKRDAIDTLDEEAQDKTHAAEGAGIGATTGALAGGAAGILASLGLLAIPGIGGLLAAGPIITALTGAGIGAAAGGIIGGLVGLGIPEDHAEEYEEGVRRGGTVVTAKVDDAKAGEAADILDRHGAVNMEQRVSTWKSAGWTPKRAPSVPASGSIPPRPQPVAHQRRADDTSRVPVVNENLDVSRRQDERGSVRVYPGTWEQTAEQVNLSKETGHVERRPADRPATPADLEFPATPNTPNRSANPSTQSQSSGGTSGPACNT